jgi:hypothetical protein
MWSVWCSQLVTLARLFPMSEEVVEMLPQWSERFSPPSLVSMLTCSLDLSLWALPLPFLNTKDENPESENCPVGG